ncbi:PBP1A family penicillin-binding protein [Phormidium sp. CLA17]|uniref:transglycosylase domain-containing protein n=1 Tax=Leptolyngbya sp. Cla-17 TaxID=2803751 RepID=UPI0014921327|nr:PBP1A family penicillin-binding protein [Leptolyngbya sp. Cla-17]MBM0742860.1 PBP1A family penicillin-binding protein [Leptolyngbya sp. Cla-17]
MGNFISKLKSLSDKSGNTQAQKSDVSTDGVPPTNGAQQDDELKSAPPPANRSPLQKLSSTLRLPQIADRAAAVANLSYKGRSIYRYKRLWLALFGLAAGGGFAWGYWSLDRTLPSTADIPKFVRRGTLTIKAADGTILQQRGPATRDKLAYKKLPEKLVQAFVASEDHRFYQHSGIDFQSIGRAIAKNVVARDVVEGASTITQQLARIVYLNQEQSLKRKVQEAMMAQKINRELSKEMILERYLNLVYLGSGAYGVGDAAWVFFGKSVNQLTLSETATIAGLPPAPSAYSPLVDLQAAQVRRDIVLARMVQAGYISEAEASAAKAEKLKIKPSTPKKIYSDTPYFTTYVQQQLPKYVSKEVLEEGGLTVDTTLNPKWQKKADSVILGAIRNIGPYEGFGQAAMVVIDPKTGEIRAMVGGDDYKKSQFNRATQAQRQPGSSFKTIVYTTALAAGFSPYDGYLDATYMVDGYKPKNANRKYSGWMSMRDAIAQSVNVIAVKVLIDVGFEPTIKMAKAMGIKSKLLPAYSLALGSSEVNLLEMTNAYATLANKGKFIEAHAIRRIFDRKGRVIYDAKFKAKQAVDIGSVAIITWMLRGVISSGTGQPAALDRPVAGKTGTSENARDLWFIGYIPQLVAGVWLGNDDNQPTGSASATAAELWHNFMVSATKGMKVEKFPELPTIDGRKGTIKAKPVQTNSTSSGFYDPEDTSGSSSGYDGSNPNSSGSGGSSDSYNSGSYSNDNSGSSQYYEPEPSAPSYQAPAAAPAPAPPVNEAPAPPPVVEPAPEPAEPEPPPPPATAPVN